MLGKALAGGRPFDTPAFKVFSSNLTPDKETGIGRWSDAELKKFMTTGERPSGVPVAPIMPTAYYKVLRPRDLDALIVYLRSVAPVRNEAPSADYKKPFGARGGAIRRQEADRGGHGAIRSSAACTSSRSATASSATRRMLQESTITGTRRARAARVFTGPWGDLRSSNITSDKTSGIGSWN